MAKQEKTGIGSDAGRGARYRITKGVGDALTFQGGEFPTYEAACAWAGQRITGFWSVVETDRFGNPVDPALRKELQTTQTLHTEAQEVSTSRIGRAASELAYSDPFQA